MTSVQEDSDRLAQLRPIGELKVVSIPFGGPEHYAFSIRPGNDVWGKSWAPRRRKPIVSQFNFPKSDETPVYPPQPPPERLSCDYRNRYSHFSDMDCKENLIGKLNFILFYVLIHKFHSTHSRQCGHLLLFPSI